jgi:hypothetical protein
MSGGYEHIQIERSDAPLAPALPDTVALAEQIVGIVIASKQAGANDALVSEALRTFSAVVCGQGNSVSVLDRVMSRG